MKNLKFEMEYNGFESIGDLVSGEDFCEVLNKLDMPGEFQGTLKVTYEYIPSEEEK